MKKALLFLVSVSIGLSICACGSKTICTTEDKNRWQDQEAFKQKLTGEGFEISEFKVTEGNCYEIYGWNKDRKKVEIYFNPVDGSKVKEEAH